MTAFPEEFPLLLPVPRENQDRLAAGEPGREAIAAFVKAAQGDPKDPDYSFMLADALSRLGRHAESVHAFEEAVRLNRREPAYHVALGAALSSVGRHEEALASFREALGLSPDDVRALNGCGLALLRLDRPREAVEALRRAVGLEPSLPEAHGNLGAALWRLGAREAALASFQEAARLRPEAAAFGRSVGVALWSFGRREEGLARFEDVLRRHPGSAEAHLDVADALCALGRRDGAAALYEAALNLDPGAAAARPWSIEARQGLLVDRIRGELKPSAPPGTRLSQLPFAGLIALGSAPERLARPFPRVARRLRAALALVLAAAAVQAIRVFVPPYARNYAFRDALVGVARMPLGTDDDIRNRLLREARETGVLAYLRRTSCAIRTRPHWRTIACEYEVPVEPLPGRHETLRFNVLVEEPYVTLEQVPTS